MSLHTLFWVHPNHYYWPGNLVKRAWYSLPRYEWYRTRSFGRRQAQERLLPKHFFSSPARQVQRESIGRVYSSVYIISGYCCKQILPSPSLLHLISILHSRNSIASAQFNMVFGRLIHFTFDALAVSTILAGVKKTTGFSWVHDLAMRVMLIVSLIPMSIFWR